MARPLKDSGRFMIVKESRALSVALGYDARDTEVDQPTGAHDASGDRFQVSSFRFQVRRQLET